MCKYVTRDCLQRIYDGCIGSDGVNNPSNNVVLGTILYFTIMWHYKHIVCSEAALMSYSEFLRMRGWEINQSFSTSEI